MTEPIDCRVELLPQDGFRISASEDANGHRLGSDIAFRPWSRVYDRDGSVYTLAGMVADLGRLQAQSYCAPKEPSSDLVCRLKSSPRNSGPNDWRRLAATVEDGRISYPVSNGKTLDLLVTARRLEEKKFCTTVPLEEEGEFRCRIKETRDQHSILGYSVEVKWTNPASFPGHRVLDVGQGRYSLPSSAEEEMELLRFGGLCGR